MRAPTLTAFFLAALLSSCADPGPTPTVSVQSSDPAMLVPDDDAADDLTIVVSYTDGDADLGGGTVEIVDCRADAIVTSLPIPPIASEAAIAEGVPIEGILEIVVADIGRVSPAAAVPAACADAGVTATPAEDSVIFCITLVDTAGHRSDAACTSGTVLTF